MCISKLISKNSTHHQGIKQVRKERFLTIWDVFIPEFKMKKEQFWLGHHEKKDDIQMKDNKQSTHFSSFSKIVKALRR